MTDKQKYDVCWQACNSALRIVETVFQDKNTMQFENEEVKRLHDDLLRATVGFIKD